MRDDRAANAVISEHHISHMTWDAAAARIAAGAIAILPIGAAAKQHGFHLPMNTDEIVAAWLAASIADQIDALIWPTLTYGYYPAFVAYAGSVSLAETTFASLVHEIVLGLLAQGCRGIVVLDTGLSTIAPVDRALKLLNSPLTLHLTIHDGPRYSDAAAKLAEQKQGSHADELETSLMLAIAPSAVDMARAEASPSVRREVVGPLSPTDTASPNYSRSGSYGDPTLATRAKGETLREAITADARERVIEFVAGLDGGARAASQQQRPRR